MGSLKDPGNYAENARSAGPDSPRGKLGIPRREVPPGHNATVSRRIVYRIIHLSFYLTFRFMFRSLLEYCVAAYRVAAEINITLARYRLPLCLCCRFEYSVSMLPPYRAIPPITLFTCFRFVVYSNRAYNCASAKDRGSVYIRVVCSRYLSEIIIVKSSAKRGIWRIVARIIIAC